MYIYIHTYTIDIRYIYIYIYTYTIDIRYIYTYTIDNIYIYICINGHFTGHTL